MQPEGMPSHGMAIPTSHRRILIVEDSIELLKLMKLFFEKADYQVVVAASAHCALEHFLTDDSIELLLLDLGLPDMDGHELARQMLAHRPVPIIVVSGYNQPHIISGALTHFAEDYVTKPFVFRELLARVQRVLRGNRVSPPLPRTATIAPQPSPVVQFDGRRYVHVAPEMAM